MKFVVTAVLGLIASWCWHSEAVAQSDVRHVTANGADFAYIEAGTGDPLLLIHGGGGDYRVWTRQVAVWAKSYRVIAYSRRNHWPNAVSADGAPDNNGRMHAEDAAALLAALGLSNVRVVGHSSGAVTALFLAANHPGLVRSLVVNEPPAAGFGGTQLLLSRAAVDAFHDNDLSRALPMFFEAVGGPGTWERKSQQERAMNMDNALSFVADHTSKEPRVMFDCGMAHRVRAPTLLLNGARSIKWFTLIIGGLRECIDNTEHVTIPDAGHNTFEQNPNAVDEAVLAYFARH